MICLLAAMAFVGDPAVVPAVVPEGQEPWLLETLPLPEGEVLEISALEIWHGDRVLVATRRGEVWVVEGVFDGDPLNCSWRKVMEGLQEPLGFLVQEDDSVLVIQRGELSRLVDQDQDGAFDSVETVCDEWRVGGNYHEYNFGPVRGKEGDIWLTTNRAFGGQPFGAPKWRGFALRIDGEGKMHPECSGLRSHAGLGAAPWGDLFYTDNQGEWVGASKLSQLIPGAFYGHPFGVASCEDPLWPYPHPGETPNRVLMPEAAKLLPHFQMPAVWFPYDEMGRSPAGFVFDETGGRFGPYEGHIFVVDQFSAEVMRVSLEQVGGHWQGACYPFRKGLSCGAIRVCWGPDGSMLIGETDRGWASQGSERFGLERLSWTGAVPFEMHTVSARPNGFHVRFTQALDPKTAADPKLWSVASYTYMLHSDYGSPEVDQAKCEVLAVTIDPDNMGVLLEVNGLRSGYVHELRPKGLRSQGGEALVDPRAYYTLIQIPVQPQVR